jgi:hypothetical protein
MLPIWAEESIHRVSAKIPVKHAVGKVLVQILIIARGVLNTGNIAPTASMIIHVEDLEVSVYG